jgi:hypothetical protein
MRNDRRTELEALGIAEEEEDEEEDLNDVGYPSSLPSRYL